MPATPSPYVPESAGGNPPSRRPAQFRMLRKTLLCSLLPQFHPRNQLVIDPVSRWPVQGPLGRLP